MIPCSIRRAYIEARKIHIHKNIGFFLLGYYSGSEGVEID